MSIGPILPGRIPSTLIATRIRDHIRNSTRLLAHLQDQIATGQRFFLPSEIPTAAIRTIALQKVLERQTQLQTNVQVDRSLLSATEASLAAVGDTLNQAKAITLAGIGDSSLSAEKEAYALEVDALITQVFNAANTKFRGRYLFGGSESLQQPFENIGSDIIRYNGDDHQIDSFIDFGFLQANNVSGKAGLAPLTPPVGGDLDPALTRSTKIADLNGGEGVELDRITVTLDDTFTVETRTVDLSGAETIGDIETILEDAFGGAAITLEVDLINNNALQLSLTSPTVGTVEVTDVDGSNTAAHLGIAGGPSTTIDGTDLDPRLTLLTDLSSLNGGTGISTTPGQGLLITSGNQTTVVDLSDPSIQTVEDLFNTLRLADLDLDVGINEAGDGIAVSSRLSGTNFSIGENGDTTAADLGIRTLTGETLLADLNLGLGVPVDAEGTQTIELEITRRDGQTVLIDVTDLNTIQDVIDAIDADPGLTASLNAVGNGITITDTTGDVGPLIVAEGEVARTLGIVGEVIPPGDSLIGTDVNPLEATGIFNILTRLAAALRSEDNVELGRLSGLLEEESDRLNQVRGEVGTRLQVLEEVENRLLDEEVRLQESLSQEFDTDLTDAITQIANKQLTLQATLQVAASTLQISLFAFL